MPLRRYGPRTCERCAGDDLAIGSHQREIFTRRDPDVERIGGPESRRVDDYARGSHRSRTDGYQSARGEVLGEERGNAIGTHSTTHERRGHLEVENAWDDDLVSTRKERHATAERLRVAPLRRAQRGHRHGRIEHVRQRRPRRRSSTADVLGSVSLNSAMKARTLRRVVFAL